MKQLFLLLFVAMVILVACNRERDDFLWEYAGGTGTAYNLAATPDSGFVSLGTIAGKPYFMRSNRHGGLVFNYSPEESGSFKSVWFDTSLYVLGGESESDLFLTMLDTAGVMVWETTVPTPISVSEVFLFKGPEPDEFMALCGSGPDDAADAISGLFLVRFDTSGAILSESTRDESEFFRISGVLAEADGGFVIAVTKAVGTAKPKAAVIKINSSLQTIWERELSNNPSYAAASLDICDAMPDGYLVSGRTELIFEETLLMNSFVALVSPAGGTVDWKKYPENSNEGVAVADEEGGLVYLLNRNCYIVNILSLTDGSDYSYVRTYNACDSYDTDAKAESFLVNYGGNLILAGSKAGNYYLALKPVVEE